MSFRFPFSFLICTFFPVVLIARIPFFLSFSGRVDDCVKRAADEGLADKLTGFKDPKEFVDSLEKPRRIMFLVKAGKPVDSTIDLFKDLLEEGDILIDGGNEW